MCRPYMQISFEVCLPWPHIFYCQLFINCLTRQALPSRKVDLAQGYQSWKLWQLSFNPISLFSNPESFSLYCSQKPNIGHMIKYLFVYFCRCIREKFEFLLRICDYMLRQISPSIRMFDFAVTIENIASGEKVERYVYVQCSSSHWVFYPAEGRGVCTINQQ